MTKFVATCHVNDTLHDAAHRMWEHDCGALPVVNDEGVLTGMITDRDICMGAYTQGRRLEDLLVNGAMAKHVVAIAPDRDIADVAELMATHRIRRIPVIDDAGRPIGIVSLNDLAIEAAQPDTAIPNATAKIAYTLAAICRHLAKEAA